MWQDAIIVIAFTSAYFLLSFNDHKEKKYVLPSMFLILALFSLEEPYVFLYALAAVFTFLGQGRIKLGKGGEAHAEEAAEEPTGEHAEGPSEGSEEAAAEKHSEEEHRDDEQH